MSYTSGNVPPSPFSTAYFCTDLNANEVFKSCRVLNTDLIPVYLSTYGPDSITCASFFSHLPPSLAASCTLPPFNVEKKPFVLWIGVFLGDLPRDYAVYTCITVDCGNLPTRTSCSDTSAGILKAAEKFIKLYIAGFVFFKKKKKTANASALSVGYLAVFNLGARYPVSASGDLSLRSSPVVRRNSPSQELAIRCPLLSGYIVHGQWSNFVMHCLT